MKLTVLKIQKEKSRYGKEFYFIFFKGDDGKSYKTCAYPSFGNWRRNGWDRVVTQGVGAMLDYGTYGVNADNSLVSADISFKLLPKEILNENATT